jgi:hypothetical protein
MNKLKIREYFLEECPFWTQLTGQQCEYIVNFIYLLLSQNNVELEKKLGKVECSCGLISKEHNDCIRASIKNIFDVCGICGGQYKENENCPYFYDEDNPHQPHILKK